MDAITIIGLIAALFTTVSLLPQLIKVYKTKSTKDISTGMFTLSGAACFYGSFTGFSLMIYRLLLRIL